MKLALLLLLLPAASFADPCKDGPPLVGLAHEGLANNPTSHLTVATTGAWAWSGADAAGKALPARHGCLDKAALDQVTAVVDGAPWTVTTKKVSCRIAVASWGVVEIKGARTFEERPCNKQLLDNASAGAVAKLHALLDKL